MSMELPGISELEARPREPSASADVLYRILHIPTLAVWPRVHNLQKRPLSILTDSRSLYPHYGAPRSAVRLVAESATGKVSTQHRLNQTRPATGFARSPGIAASTLVWPIQGRRLGHRQPHHTPSTTTTIPHLPQTINAPTAARPTVGINTRLLTPDNSAYNA